MTTHDDLHRDFGRMEGKQDAMGGRLDKLEKALSDGFKAINERLDKIDARESERKGGLAVLVSIAGLLGAAVTALFQYFGK